MHGKMQESGLTKIIPLICTSAIWGQYPVFSHPVSSGLFAGSGCSLMAARWQVFFSVLSFLRAHRLMLEGCNNGRLWHPLFTDMAGNIPFINIPFIRTFKLRTFKDANVELTNEDLLELEAQRNNEEEQEEEEVTEEPKRLTTQEMARGFSLFEEAVSFWGTGPKLRMVHEGYSSHSECNPVLPSHLCWEKKSYYPGITGSFFQEGR